MGAVTYVDAVYSLTDGMVSFTAVPCPTETQVIGGGLRTQQQYTKTLKVVGAPDPVATAWHVEFDNSDSSSATMVTVYAVCLQVVT